MAQFFENENMISENTCEVLMNDVIEEVYEINPDLQSKRNQNPKMKKILKNYKLKKNVKIIW
jgi:hypothetical protein